MGDNKNDKNIEVSVIEKRNLFQKIGDKKAAFAEKHPVASRRIGTVFKVTIGAAAGLVAGAFLGSRSKESDGIEMIDLDDVEFEDINDNNDNN